MDSDGMIGSPPKLDPSTLALLNSFLASKADEERRFNELSLQYNSNNGETPSTVLSLQEFRDTFKEDWQLSQFWYTDDFASTLVDSLVNLLSDSPDIHIGFMCCPTGYVAFQHSWSAQTEGRRYSRAKLFEIDQRFSVLAGEQYVHYDLFKPEEFPEECGRLFDLVVVDPPFLNEDTNACLKETLKSILKPEAKLLLITSPSIGDVLEKIYTTPPVGPLRETQLAVAHNQLANDFQCWGNWEGAESFGAVVK